MSNEEENYIMIAIWTEMMTIDKDDDKYIKQGCERYQKISFD